MTKEIEMATAREAEAAAAANAPNGPVGDQSAQNTAPAADGGVSGNEAAGNPEGGVPSENPPNANDVQPSDEQKAVQEEEARIRAEDPNTVVGREANAEFGGESFDYGGKPDANPAPPAPAGPSQ